MRDVFKLVEMLVTKRVHICLSCQFKNGAEFYAVSVNDIHGQQHTFSGWTLEEVETNLKIIWGHLLTETVRTLPPMPPLPKMM
jgi:hypothetical protein